MYGSRSLHAFVQSNGWMAGWMAGSLVRLSLANIATHIWAKIFCGLELGAFLCVLLLALRGPLAGIL